MVVLAGCVRTENINSGTGDGSSNSNFELEAMINETPGPNKTIVMKTNKGDITIELFNETMPITANNFLRLVEEDFYDGIIFHRIIEGFMIQGGDPQGTGMGGPGYSIPDEFTDSNRNQKGTLSMANSGPDTGGSQFFINLVDNDFLDDKHPVFGRVTGGLDIVELIGSVDTDETDRPLEDVVIQDIEVN